MKKSILLSVLIVCGQLIFAQNTKLSETEKLAATAKIWGFLKYYHPEVAEGKYDWDDQLFEILPKIRNAENKEDLSQLFLNWIGRLGEVKDCRKCEKESNAAYFEKNFDLSWIESEPVFSQKLTESLRHIEKNRHQGKKHYVSVSGAKNIQITNEEPYDVLFSWKSEDLRLLSLFRYWNIVEYFFPYKYQTDTPWDEVLNQMIPRFLNPHSETDFHLAMKELIVNIDDSHGVFITEQTNDFFGLKWIPAKFSLVNEKAIVTGFYNDSLAELDDLRLGDIITKVDGEEVGEIFSDKEKYINGSNLSSKKANAPYAIFNGSSDAVNIEYFRNGICYDKMISRYLFQDFDYNWKANSEKYTILKGNIGYVNMGVITIKDVPALMKALKDTKSIIFDIRNYPNGTLYSIAGYITSKRSDFFKMTYPDLNYPGKFIWGEGNRCGNKKELIYKGKVVLLVNEKTQSHAEFTAMCLQTGDNVITMGSQTSGADGNVSRFQMIGGYDTMISGIGIFYPDGTKTQRKGVKIDIEVEPTIEGLAEGRDEVLERAKEFVK